jgi:hypothetical protein
VLHDTAAALPDDVFAPEDVRASMDPGINQQVLGARALVGGGGGRRGCAARGRIGAAQRGGPSGRGGYARGRGRESAYADGHVAADMGFNGNNQRRREGVLAPGQARAPHGRRQQGSGEGASSQEGPRSWEGNQEGGGREGTRGGRGGSRGRSSGARPARGAQPPVATWVPLQAS